MSDSYKHRFLDMHELSRLLNGVGNHLTLVLDELWIVSYSCFDSHPLVCLATLGVLLDAYFSIAEIYNFESDPSTDVAYVWMCVNT